MNDSRGVFSADLDSDSNPDLIFANLANRNRVCLGDGAGGFACSDVSSLMDNTRSVAIGALGLRISTLLITVPPVFGSALTNPDGTITYTSNPGFVGTDTFQYSIEGAQAVVTVTVSAVGLISDLAVTQIHSGPVTVGQTLTFDVSAKNLGPDTATAVEFLGQLGGSVDLVSATTDQGSCLVNRLLVSCQLGVLPAQSEATIVVSLVPVRSGTVSHQAKLVSSTPEPDLKNNVDLQTATAVPVLVSPVFLEDDEGLLERTFIGLAAVNPGQVTTEVSLSSRDAEGVEQAQELLADPLTAMGQRALLTDQIETQGGTTLLAEGLLTPIQGMFMVGDYERLRLDGVGRLDESNELYFLIASKTGSERTLLFIFNPGPDSDPDVKLALFDSEGALRGEVSFELASKGTLTRTIGEIFGEQAVDMGEGYVRVRAKRPVRGLQIDFSEDSFSALGAQAVNPWRETEAPHFFVDASGSATVMDVLNAGYTTCQVRVEAFDSQSNLIASAVFEIEPGKLLTRDLAELLGIDTSGQTGNDGLTGYLKLEATGGFVGTIRETPGLVGSINLVLGTQAATRYPLRAPRRTDALLPHIAQSEADGYYTSLIILNSQAEPAHVGIRIFDLEGVLTGGKELEVGPGQGVMELLNTETFFGSGFQQVNGHAEISSDVPVALLGIYGNYGNQSVAAIALPPLVR